MKRRPKGATMKKSQAVINTHKKKFYERIWTNVLWKPYDNKTDDDENTTTSAGGVGGGGGYG